MGKRLGLALITAGAIGFCAAAMGIIYTYQRIREIKNTTPYSQLINTERQIYRIEHTSLVNLLSSDPNLPQNIPELMEHYNKLIARRDELEEDPNVLVLKSKEGSLNNAGGASIIAGAAISGFFIYLGSKMRAEAKYKTRKEAK